MPQERILLASGRTLKVERLVSHAASCEWSPVYLAPAPRVVFPCNEAAVEFRTQGVSLLADMLTACALKDAQPYQLRPLSLQDRRSVVVSAADGARAGTLGRAAASFAVPASLLYRLRVHWRDLESGRERTDFTGRLLAHALPARAIDANAGAVLRARRFLASPGESGPRRTLGEIADAACASPFHLTRAFKRETGWGLHRYRQQLRLAAALARLEQGERDLVGLAHDLGFSSQSHFGAVFRAEVGVTPGQARRTLAP